MSFNFGADDNTKEVDHSQSDVENKLKRKLDEIYNNEDYEIEQKRKYLNQDENSSSTLSDDKGIIEVIDDSKGEFFTSSISFEDDTTETWNSSSLLGTFSETDTKDVLRLNLKPALAKKISTNSIRVPVAKKDDFYYLLGRVMKLRFPNMQSQSPARSVYLPISTNSTETYLKNPVYIREKDEFYVKNISQLFLYSEGGDFDVSVSQKDGQKFNSVRYYANESFNYFDSKHTTISKNMTLFKSKNVFNINTKPKILPIFIEVEKNEITQITSTLDEKFLTNFRPNLLVFSIDNTNVVENKMGEFDPWTRITILYALGHAVPK